MADGRERAGRRDNSIVADRLREPEIQHLDPAVGAIMTFCGLEVAVDDALGVRGVERVGNLDGDRQRISSGRTWFDEAVRSSVRERVAIQQFQHRPRTMPRSAMQ